MTNEYDILSVKMDGLVATVTRTDEAVANLQSNHQAMMTSMALVAEALPRHEKAHYQLGNNINRIANRLDGLEAYRDQELGRELGSAQAYSNLKYWSITTIKAVGLIGGTGIFTGAMLAALRVAVELAGV